VRIACYAQGGGLGHLTRIRAALHTLYPGERATIFTGSPFAADPRIIGPHDVRTLSPLYDLDELLVDAFPAGLHGELTAATVPPGVRVTHLARLLRWDAYAPLLPAAPVRFDRTWLLEPVTRPHADFLRSVSGEVAPLALVDPPADTAEDVAGAWLVVHAGPDEEIRELVGYARDMAEAEAVRPRFLLVAPRVPAGLDVTHLDTYPAWPLAATAGRIVTAAGFNAVRQFQPWRAKHRMLPFPRRFDDQFRRAAAAR
jgi:hypothetical protein